MTKMIGIVWMISLSLLLFDNVGALMYFCPTAMFLCVIGVPAGTPLVICMKNPIKIYIEKTLLSKLLF